MYGLDRDIASLRGTSRHVLKSASNLTIFGYIVDIYSTFTILKFQVIRPISFFYINFLAIFDLFLGAFFSHNIASISMKIAS